MRFFRVRKLILFLSALVLIFELVGCESLGRKFVRKPKAEDKKTEEVVFSPQEYKGEGVTNEDLYKQYFLYWRTWQEEPKGNHKRQIDSINEGLKNLENIKLLVKPEAAARLEEQIKNMQALRQALVKDIYFNNVTDNRRRADRLRRDILKDFSFGKIKDSIL
jgi:hypothetical protein